ncbi:Na/Pi cotransporter family protein [uncultured Sunxiuqinia sp.]|uniref:Na/Pi cotransporter family protein n=1 Tax=uncultured Sunxiuqinia sp. TaxID=1573825 RepID=UPI0026137058|nr:Na/Pi cotransporter family protein [uncultured Sunxiuqinia sp.]
MNYSIFDLLKLLGSLGFFLFGMKLMSESLQKVAGDRLRGILSAMTSNRFKGIFTGFLVTAIIQSSSATTVMLVSFVNAGLVTFAESIGVIMGSNIGTTVTAWLISILGFKVEISMLVLPLIGITFPLLFSKNTNRNNWGSVIIGFAIIFIGLDFLNHSTPDINSNPEILRFLTNFSNYGYGSVLIFLFIGVILTMLIQSSSAVMALTLVMCFNGWIAFDMAAAMVLGQNIGTTITANLAALVANTSAKRTATAHLFFNMLGVLLLLPVFFPFLDLISSITVHNGFDSPLATAGQTTQQTAAAIPIALSIFHTIFNLLNTFILIWFVKPLEKLIVKIVKQKEDDEEFRLQFISTGLLSTIDLSILQARKELMVYTERVEKMFFHTRELLQTHSDKKITHYQHKIKKYEEISDQLEVEIAAYLAEVSKQELSHQAAENINKMLQITTHIESIADSCYSISKAISRKTSGKLQFNEEMYGNLLRFSDRISELFCLMIGVVKDAELSIDIHEVRTLMQNIKKDHDKLQQEHFKNLRKGGYKTKVGVIYADIYTELLKMGVLADEVVSLLVYQEKPVVEKIY